MTSTNEQRDWLAFRKALGDALAAKDLVEVDYEFDIPEDLPEDMAKLIDAINRMIDTLRILKEDLR